MRALWNALFAFLVACSTGGSADVRELEDKVDALSARVQQLESENAEQAQALANAEAALGWAAGMLDVMTLNGGGDVVFSDVNVYVQSGAGTTAGDANGKGNLIVGYDEDRREGACVGGPSEGAQCFGDAACGGGTCVFTVTSEKIGSHNLIVGSGHSYTGIGNVIAGQDNTADGTFGLCGGNRNTVAGTWSTVAGGSQNHAEGTWNTIVGGGGNHTVPTAEHAVVIGGSGNEASGANTIVP